MATTYTHAQIGIVDASGNVNVIYPITTGADVSIVRTNNANIPTTGTTAQKLADALGALAFKNVADIISTDGTATATNKTWSSSVIDAKLTELSSKTDNMEVIIDDITRQYQKKNIITDADGIGYSLAPVFQKDEVASHICYDLQYSRYVITTNNGKIYTSSTIDGEWVLLADIGEPIYSLKCTTYGTLFTTENALYAITQTGVSLFSDLSSFLLAGQKLVSLATSYNKMYIVLVAVGNVSDSSYIAPMTIIYTSDFTTKNWKKYNASPIGIYENYMNTNGELEVRVEITANKTGTFVIACGDLITLTTNSSGSLTMSKLTAPSNTFFSYVTFSSHGTSGSDTQGFLACGIYRSPSSPYPISGVLYHSTSGGTAWTEKLNFSKFGCGFQHVLFNTYTILIAVDGSILYTTGDIADIDASSFTVGNRDIFTNTNISNVSSSNTTNPILVISKDENQPLAFIDIKNKKYDKELILEDIVMEIYNSIS